MDRSGFAAFPDLADLPAAELDQLADVVAEVEVEAGAEFIRLDAYGTAVYFIEQGEAEVRMADGGTEALGPGDMCGEIALLLTGQRTATVVARTPMRLLQLSGQDFERIRDRVPQLERTLRGLGLERAPQT
jgi:CRP/FNR family transcriptional regulator, cyclic AMP receptor protein